MSSLLPDECFSDVLSFLDEKSLYKCLFVNRFYCKLSIPIIWRNPFSTFYTRQFSSINTLLACLNEDEISSLIPCVINFNNQSPLFEYGKFIRKIDHGSMARYIKGWLGSSSERVQDCRVRKLINVIYHMIMRQGSNLQELIVGDYDYIDLPKFSVFTTYKPGITNLRSFEIELDRDFGDKFQNTIEFLSMVSNFYNGIANCKLWIFDSFSCAALNFIKLQPLERLTLYISHSLDRGNDKKIINALKFRSETLKELSFYCLDFRGIDLLSFLSKLEYLEHLEFRECSGFMFNEALSKKMFHLKELKLWDCDMKVSMINSLCSETLLKLSLTNATPEIIKVVKESCPNISFLQISELHLDSIIPLICELSSLRILYISTIYCKDVLVRTLGDYLTAVEFLFLGFSIDLRSFKYFANKCRANLKKWVIVLDDESLRKDYLVYVNNFQKVNHSLKVLGINHHYVMGGWTNEELEIIDSLKNQGVDIVSSYDDEYSILLKLFI